MDMMTRKCSVRSCSNTYSKTKNICVIDEKSCSLTLITYHSFPRQHHLRKKWIQATGRINWEPTNGSYICSEHFKASDYDIIEQNKAENDDQLTQVRRILKKEAVPTQQLSIVLKAKDNVYSNENNVGASSESTLSDLSSVRNELTYSGNNDIDLNKVKEEPVSSEELDSEQQGLPFMITSAVTVKEENEHSDRHNGVFESQLFPPNDYSDTNHLDPNVYGHRPKRLKHEDSLIPPEDIKIERRSPVLSFNCNLTIEEKYERLLDEFLKLKRDYDLLKFKCDFQSDAIYKCEQILKGCR